MDAWRPRNLIFHDYGGTPQNADGVFNPYHALVFPDGKIRYRNPANPYAAPAPHAYKLNPASIGLSYAGPVGSTPTPEALNALKQEYQRIKSLFPDIEALSHGEAYQRTKGTPQQASRLGRGLDEASWRTILLGTGAAPAGLTPPQPQQAPPPPVSARPAQGAPMTPQAPQSPQLPAYTGATPNDVETQRKMAQALMMQGMSTEPVGHWTQALARVLQGGVGGMYQAQASEGEKSRQNALAQALAGSGTFGSLSEGDRAIMTQNPEILQSVAGKAFASKLDPMAGINRKSAELGIKLKERQLAAPADDGSKIVTEGGKIYRVPRQGPAVAIGGTNPMEARHNQAVQLGLQPGSPEYTTLMTNGKLPAAFYEQTAQKRLKQESAGKIEAGLKNMAKMAEKYDNASFTNAVGPFQGSTPDSLIGAAGVNAARFGGEILNRLQGGTTAPTEVRSNIQGSTEALAAAIKPLIRGPGEGVWTDADQARLVAVVGDLATSSTKEEYLRRLNDLRDRIKSNFGLDINFDAILKKKQRAPLTQQSNAAPIQIKGINDYNSLPPGTPYIDPNGVQRIKGQKGTN